MGATALPQMVTNRNTGVLFCSSVDQKSYIVLHRAVLLSRGPKEESMFLFFPISRSSQIPWFMASISVFRADDDIAL